MRTPRMLTALTVAGLLTLAGCSASSGNDSADSAGDSGVSGQAPAQDGGGNGSGDEAASSDKGGDTAAEPAPADLGDAAGGTGDTSDANIADAGRSVITEGTVTMTVEDPEAVVQDITRDVSTVEGWVEGLTQRAATDTEGASATLVVRVPSADVSGTLDHLATYGTVESVDLSRTDVTLQVTDLQARIDAMKMSVDRMETFLAQAANRQDLLEAEQMLTDRQAQLESLLSEQRVLGDQVSMSKLTITLWSPESAPPEPEPTPEPETGFFAGLANGWNAFYDFGAGALLVIGALLPWLAFGAGIAAVAYVIARPIRRRQAAKAPSAASPAGPTTTLPPLGQPVAYRTGPAGPPAPGPHPTAAQLLDAQPPAPPAPPQAPAGDPGQTPAPPA